MQIRVILEDGIPRGWIKEIVALTGLTRQTIWKYRKGIKVKTYNAERIEDAIAQLQNQNHDA